MSMSEPQQHQESALLSSSPPLSRFPHYGLGDGSQLSVTTLTIGQYTTILPTVLVTPPSKAEFDAMCSLALEAEPRDEVAPRAPTAVPNTQEFKVPRKEVPWQAGQKEEAERIISRQVTEAEFSRQATSADLPNASGPQQQAPVAGARSEQRFIRYQGQGAFVRQSFAQRLWRGTKRAIGEAVSKIRN
jgi:hypothetical protein